MNERVRAIQIHPCNIHQFLIYIILKRCSYFRSSLFISSIYLTKCSLCVPDSPRGLRCFLIPAKFHVVPNSHVIFLYFINQDSHGVKAEVLRGLISTH